MTEEAKAAVREKGYEIVEGVRDNSRRTHGTGGFQYYFSKADEAIYDAEEAVEATRLADYAANHKYKDDRRKAYGDIGDQLDMQYWDLVNGTTTFKDYVAAVKSAHPKPE